MNAPTADVCPDPWTHDRDYRASETTWRKTADQKKADRADGCPQCGGRVKETQWTP